MSNALREILAAHIRGVEAPGSLYKKAADELSLEIMQLRAIAKEQHDALNGIIIAEQLGGQHFNMSHTTRDKIANSIAKYEAMCGK